MIGNLSYYMGKIFTACEYLVEVLEKNVVLWSKVHHILVVSTESASPLYLSTYLCYYFWLAMEAAIYFHCLPRFVATSLNLRLMLANIGTDR